MQLTLQRPNIAVLVLFDIYWFYSQHDKHQQNLFSSLPTISRLTLNGPIPDKVKKFNSIAKISEWERNLQSLTFECFLRLELIVIKAKLLLTHTFKIHPIFLLKVSLNSVSEYKHSTTRLLKNSVLYHFSRDHTISRSRPRNLFVKM